MVADAAGVFEAEAEFECGGDGDVNTFGSELFAEADGGVHVTLARKCDEEDMARSFGHRRHFTPFFSLFRC